MTKRVRSGAARALQGGEVLVYSDESRDPVTNIERETRIFEKVEARELPEVLRFWVNSPCLVRGPAKVPQHGWYNERLAKETKVHVFTRSSGGGVVYQDEGNLNWSFFFPTSGSFVAPSAAFALGSRHIVMALKALGAKATYSPPNRIDVLGYKVSGMAARSTPRTLLVHGTLLLNSDLNRLNALCVPPPGCPPVANLSTWIEGINPAIVEEAVTRELTRSGMHPRKVDQIDSTVRPKGRGRLPGAL